MSDRLELIQRTIADIVGAINIAKVYPKGHLEVLRVQHRLFDRIVLALDKCGEISFILLNQMVYFNKLPIIGDKTVIKAFYAIFYSRGIERLTFLKGIQKYELERFLEEVYADKSSGIKSQDHIKIGRILPQQDLGLSVSKKQWATHTMESVYSKARMNKELQVMDVNHVAMELIKTFNKMSDPFKYLIDIKTEDEYTYIHMVNVALLTMKLASKTGFSGQLLVDIVFAALMHDIGKVMIPEEILKKPGSLDETEMEIMRTHPVLGAKYLMLHRNLPQITIVAAMEHHIKYNGEGYPHIQSGWQPHIISQMISVCDVYDALRSNRPYHAAMFGEEINKRLNKESGSSFNPMLVHNLIQLLSVSDD
ncbi:MAG: HD-GYP domain-containing protein [Acetivibrionales bacterium]|jgi:putative nucleotidyltransferase with HDIG domain